MSQIGVLILMGIVVNNGIVLLDHINQLRNAGMATEAAILQAGRDRMRAYSASGPLRQTFCRGSGVRGLDGARRLSISQARAGQRSLDDRGARGLSASLNFELRTAGTS